MTKKKTVAKTTKRKKENVLVVGYDPAKSAPGGLAAIYNGKLVWAGQVLLWDIEEEQDIVSGFENIRTAWLDCDDFDPEITESFLYFERSQHGAHFARAAISEAAGAAFPAFVKLIAGDKNRCKPVFPRQWRTLLYGDSKQPDDVTCKRDALRFVAETYGFFTDSHDVAEACCIATYAYRKIMSEKDAAAAKKVKAVA